MRRRTRNGVKPADRQEAESEEKREHDELRGGEGRLGLGRRQRLQEGQLLECLHDTDEHVEIERSQRRRHVDPAPGAGEPEGVERKQRYCEHHQRDGTDHVRRQEAVEGEHEPGHACQDRRREEQRGPAARPLRVQHAVEDDEAGGDPDQADDDMQRRERRQRQTQGHGASHSAGSR
jgi:hypothetical protein